MSRPTPLAGLTAVDQADERGELRGRLLAELGADVVRVEPPHGSPSRRLGPFHGGESLQYLGNSGAQVDALVAKGVVTDDPRRAQP